MASRPGSWITPMMKAPPVLARSSSSPWPDGCYVPVRFDAEVVVINAAFMKCSSLATWPIRTFTTVCAKANFTNRRTEKGRANRNGFDPRQRDQEIQIYQAGLFELNWEKKGDLLRVGNVTFIRRNEEFSP